MKRTLFAVFLAVMLVAAVVFITAPNAKAATILTPADATNGKITISTAGQILDLQGAILTVEFTENVELSVIDTTIKQNQDGTNNAGTLTVKGNGTIAAVTVDPTDKVHFLAIATDGVYSVYPFDLAISKAGINTIAKNPDDAESQEPATCIRASFMAFKPVIDKIDAYGFIVKGEKYPVTKEFANSITHAYADLQGSFRENLIDTPVTIQAYMTIDDVDYKSSNVTVTPKDILQKLNLAGERIANNDQLSRINAWMDETPHVKNILSFFRAEKLDEPADFTVNFDDASSRTFLNKDKQVWTAQGVTFINDQNSSTNTVGDYVKPVRLYKSSGITIIAGDINKIVFNCNSDDYAKALEDSIKATDNITVSLNENTVTVTFKTPVNVFSIAALSAQVRLDSVTVSAKAIPGECDHNGGTATCTEKAFCADCDMPYGVVAEHSYNSVVTDATCTAGGYTTHTCSACSHTYTDNQTEALGHTTENGTCGRCEQVIGGQTPTTGILAEFTFGSNGSAAHVDGNDLGSSKSYTEGDYTLALQSMSKVYGPAYDAKGNSCIKLGTSSVVGTFSFTVPENVTEVTIYIAKYKANTTKITVNGAAYTLANSSNNGMYDAIVVDTSATKTVTLSTVSGGVRAMVDKITFFGYISGGETPDTPACEHTNTTTTTVDATCTAAGSNTVTCDDCGETVSTEEIAALGHTTENGVCDNCGETIGSTTPSEPKILATFALGANGSASHNDGTSKTSYSETNNGYTLSISNATNFYTGARDAKGNSCVKFGSSKQTGSCTFTVPNDVTSVVIYVAQYKANNTKVTINGTSYTISGSSNDGAYDAIEIDTSTTKTISFATVSSNQRAMMNTIEFYGYK